MSTPAWFDTYDRKDSQVATVFVDARTWPPAIVTHARRTSAAARLSDGRWACVARHADGWRILWFASIAAAKPARVEAVPFEVPPPERTAAGDEPPADPGPIARLHAFTGKLLAIPIAGPVHVRNGDGAWREHARLRGKAHTHARNVMIDGREHLEWDGALYDSELELVDALGCTFYASAADRVFAIHGEQLVERDASGKLVARLPGHTVSNIEPGPRQTLILSLQRDTDRGTEIERVIYDPVTATVTALPRELIGETPHLVACTNAGDLVLHVDRDHQLACLPAARLAALPKIADADLTAPTKHQLPLLDDLGAASRPLVATTGKSIAIALGRELRVHDLDAPKTVVGHPRPIVGVAARPQQLAALDDAGVLHTYTLEGDLVTSRPTLAAPRSLAADRSAWIVVGADRIVRVENTQTTVIEIAGAAAVAADPNSGELLIACDDRRLACWSGELRDLPPTIEQVVAVAPLGNRTFACAGARNLYLLDLAMPELVELDLRGRRPHLAATGAGRVAICTAAGSLQAYDLENLGLVAVEKGGVYYSSYGAPDHGEITVHGLAFMEDGRLVVLLDDGRANIVNPDTGAALKLDPQPGDAASSWVFLTGAGILVAG